MNRETSTDVLFYVQHLLGIGHLRRAAVIARALHSAGTRVVFVSGGLPVKDLDIGGCELVQLPPARVLDEDFSIVDEDGRPIDAAWKESRCAKLLEIYRRRRPRLLLIELFPFGRRQMRFELLPLLETVRAEGPGIPIVCSLRDVLTTHKQPGKTAWMIDTFQRFFDLLIVHGDPAFLPLERSFPDAGRIAAKTRYSGYVVPETPGAGDISAEGPGKGEVVVSTGGGAVAGPLVAAALQARAVSPLAEVPWRLLIGLGMREEEFLAVRAAASDGIRVERARPDFINLLARARLSISQGGYNTVMELLSLGTPAVVVPFAAGSETEQSLRARLLAERGLITVVEEKGLTGASLAAGIEAALRRPRQPPPSFDWAGARNTARLLCDLLGTAPR